MAAGEELAGEDQRKNVGFFLHSWNFLVSEIIVKKTSCVVVTKSRFYVRQAIISLRVSFLSCFVNVK